MAEQVSFRMGCALFELLLWKAIMKSTLDVQLFSKFVLIKSKYYWGTENIRKHWLHVDL